jgi:polyhydroxyalkanoate synthesis regulator phasin
MAGHDDRSLFQRIRELGEEQLNRVLDDVMSSPRFADILGKTIQQAMATKGTMDRNMQTILSLLNLPSKADYKKLATKIEALQGSLVNLNIKLDRMLAQQHEKSKPGPSRAKPKPRPAAKSPASEASSL